MKCRIAQIEIGSGSALSPAGREHLDACEECRRFATSLDGLRVLGRSSLATPPNLREQTLDHCQRLLAEKTAESKMSFGQRLRRRIDSPGFIVIFGTLSVIILVGLTAMQLDGMQDKTAGNILKVVIIQLVVQNLAAALFLPALMFLRNRPDGRFSHTTEIGV